MRDFRSPAACLAGARVWVALTLSLAVASVPALLWASPAFADEVVGTASLAGGSLSFTAPTGPSFRGTVSGTDQTVSATVNMSAVDTRGTGAGWNVQITSTTFSTGGPSPHTLPNNALTVSTVSAICAGGTCTTPTNTISYPLVVPADSAAPTAIKLFEAAPETGMGEFTISPTFSLLVPGTAYAGDYTSVITVTIASGT